MIVELLVGGPGWWWWLGGRGGGWSQLRRRLHGEAIACATLSRIQQRSASRYTPLLLHSKTRGYMQKRNGNVEVRHASTDKPWHDASRRS